METLKGFARRTTQSLREMVSRTEVSPEEMRLTEVMAKVRIMETKGEMICEKVIQAARLMGELGTTLREIGEEYKGVPDLPKESRELADDVFEVGVKLVETSQEHQKGLKDNGFELLRSFAKQCAQLREVEDARRHHQLEYDFFKSKVQYLRSSPQRDFTRLPRNEQILENWRVELWRATERSKALCSELFVSGRQAIDRSVLTTIQVLHSFVEIASTGFSQTFQGTAVAVPTGAIIPASPGTQAPMPGTAYASTSLPSPANPPGPVAAPQPAPLAPAIGTPYGGAPSYAVTPGAAGRGPAGYQPPPLDIPTSTDNGTTTYQPPPLQ
ncbi:hypothetical protein CGC21_36370 [Leishmania donovani]|uniref:BAR domain-containing protein n=1 Tax=Leishmania donovani TaxID=5661 RepID=A0A504XBM0_LEIDO|nr:hypothetical protein CGC21_36370 [Leishmania donovani]